MKGKLLGDMDLDFLLTREDFLVLFFDKETLTCKLNFEGKDIERSAEVKFSDSEGMCDGMMVKYDEKTDTYKIEVNSWVREMLEERGKWGSRYGAGEKITFYTLDAKSRPFFEERQD